ncbi:hypothetical protein B0T19DRAFT_473912 [Cercophora scortea]|uniref:Uncharacterized protein n=1 Tax=Cercophora scortea TaxID=314031 RepID=A0AAE0MHZ1_9PEZI|nr:hypothetical protein B0T19DRAFT_473912 [Cercophora scortea]
MSAIFDHPLITHPIFTHPGVWIHPGTLKGTDIFQPWLNRTQSLNNSYAIFRPRPWEPLQQHPVTFAPLSSSYNYHSYRPYSGQGSHCSVPHIFDNISQISRPPWPLNKPSFQLNPLAPVFKPRPFRSLLDPEAVEFRPRPPAIVNGTTPIAPSIDRYLSPPNDWRRQGYVPREHTERSIPIDTHQPYSPYEHTQQHAQRRHHKHKQNHKQNYNHRNRIKQPSPLRQVQTPTPTPTTTITYNNTIPTTNTPTTSTANDNNNLNKGHDPFPDAKACIVLHTSHNASPGTIPELCALVNRHTDPLPNGQPAGTAIIGATFRGFVAGRASVVIYFRERAAAALVAACLDGKVEGGWRMESWVQYFRK